MCNNTADRKSCFLYCSPIGLVQTYAQGVRINFFFFFFLLNCFWRNRSPNCLNSPLPPLRGQPTGKCHPRWQPIEGLAVHCRLGRLVDSNPGLQFHNLVSLRMSHHCSGLIYAVLIYQKNIFRSNNKIQK